MVCGVCSLAAVLLSAGDRQVLTETGVLSEVPQEGLALLLLVPTAPTGAPQRDGKVAVA